MNHYAVLGIDESATIEQIKETYKNLSKRYHPNSTSSERSSEKFIEVKKSYDFLLKNHRPKTTFAKQKKEEFNGERYYRIINPTLDIKSKFYECTIEIPENVLAFDTKIHCMWTNEFTITLDRGKSLPIRIEVPILNNKLYMNIITGF